MTKLMHPITFIDKLIKKNERGDTFRLMDHQREILRLAFDFERGRTAARHDSLFLRRNRGKRRSTGRPRRQSGFFRLTKENQKRKIDACVALSLRLWAR